MDDDRDDGTRDNNDHIAEGGPCGGRQPLAFDAVFTIVFAAIAGCYIALATRDAIRHEHPDVICFEGTVAAIASCYFLYFAFQFIAKLYLRMVPSRKKIAPLTISGDQVPAAPEEDIV